MTELKARCEYCGRRLRRHAAAVLTPNLPPVPFIFVKEHWYSMLTVHAHCWRVLTIAERLTR